jgi:hypothetical protein
VNCCEYSFAASPGWDAVTGLGSPNFNILANLVLNNNTAFPNLGAYPAGSAATVSSGDDDDEVKAVGISALVIGVVAFVIAAVAVGLAGVLYSGRNSAKGSGAGASSQNPMSSGV